MKRKSKVLFYHLTGEAVHVLFGKRTSGWEEFWWLPGGSAEGNENIFEAAVRELNEELELPVVFKEHLENYSDESLPAFISYSTDTSLVTVFFINVNEKEETIACREEFTEVKWFPLSHLPTNMSREFSNIRPYITESFLRSLEI